MKLIDPTDDALNEAFAVHVAKWTLELYPADFKIPRFTSSADAVLPWLEKAGAWNVFRAVNPNGPGYIYELELSEYETEKQANIFVFSQSFPRAAVIALLRAHGVEIEFTK